MSKEQGAYIIELLELIMKHIGIDIPPATKDGKPGDPGGG